MLFSLVLIPFIAALLVAWISLRPFADLREQELKDSAAAGNETMTYLVFGGLTVLTIGIAMRDSLRTAVNTPELRFPCSDTEKFPIVDQIKKSLAASGAKVNAVDGVRVDTNDGWWLLRASNTQDVLVARCEGFDEAGLARLKTELVAALAGAGVAAPDLS